MYIEYKLQRSIYAESKHHEVTDDMWDLWSVQIESKYPKHYLPTQFDFPKFFLLSILEFSIIPEFQHSGTKLHTNRILAALINPLISILTTELTPPYYIAHNHQS